MDNEQTIMAAVVVAVMAMVMRIALRRGQEDKAIDWMKIISIVSVVGTFLAVFLSVDPYRISIWRDGAASADECRAGHVIGREAGPDVTLADSLKQQGMPIFFAFRADSVAPTGYWRLKRADRAAEEAVERQLSLSDSGRVAIQRKTNKFVITRHPSDLSAYVPLWRVTLPSGQKILAEIPEYDAKPGTLPICALRFLDDRMVRIAEADSMVSREVFAQCYDETRMANKTVEYVMTKAAAGAIAAVLVIILLVIIRRAMKKE